MIAVRFRKKICDNDARVSGRDTFLHRNAQVNILPSIGMRTPGYEKIIEINLASWDTHYLRKLNFKQMGDNEND